MLVLGSWGLGPVLVLNTGNGSFGVSAWNHLPYSSWRWWRTVPNKNSNYGAESKHTTKPEWKQLAHGTTAENQDFMLAAVSPLHAFPKYILWHTAQINARLARLYQQSLPELLHGSREAGPARLQSQSQSIEFVNETWGKLQQRQNFKEFRFQTFSTAETFSVSKVRKVSYYSSEGAARSSCQCLVSTDSAPGIESFWIVLVVLCYL